MLLKEDRVVTAPVKCLLEAFPECMEEDLEQYLVSMCNPTMVVKCTFKGSDLLSMKFQIMFMYIHVHGYTFVDGKVFVFT